MISFLRRHRKSIFIATITTFLAGMFVGLGGYWFTSRDNEGIAARVGGAKIKEETVRRRVEQYAEAMRQQGRELDDAGMARLRREMLNDMMVDEMLAVYADTLGLKVTDDELARDIRGTRAFQTEDGKFSQDLYFRQVRAAFRESPQEYERSRRKSIKAVKVKQLIWKMAKVPPQEIESTLVEAKKQAPKKDAGKITRESVAEVLQRQRAIELINQCLKTVSTQVEHQEFAQPG